MSVMPKQKISVTIEKTAVQWVDDEVKTGRYRNRSHAVDEAIKKLKEAP